MGPHRHGTVSLHAAAEAAVLRYTAAPERTHPPVIPVPAAPTILPPHANPPLPRYAEAAARHAGVSSESMGARPPVATPAG